MLKNLWYAVEFSHAVTNKPLKMQCLGQHFVLWRNRKGEISCLSDLCVHRGGSLAGGWLTPDESCIVCPYHGWEFEGDGACSRIPAQPQRGIPKKARVDSYPVKEKYGLVFVFLGDLPEEERPPLPDIPELEDETMARVYGEYNWNVNYERAMENAMDPSHAPFVHGNRFGNPDKPEVADFDVVLTEWSGLADIPLYPPPGNPKGAWGKLFRKSAGPTGEPVMVKTRAGFFLPNMNILHVHLPFGNLILIDANVPIDEHRTRSLFIGLRDFIKGKWADKDAIKRIKYIFEQDDAVISLQRPELLPFDLTDEMHVRSDALQVAYRRRRNQLIEAGWGIDTHQIVGDGPRDLAVVIPSPARKNNPELANAWVHKEVESAKIRSKRTIGGDAAFEKVEGRALSLGEGSIDAAPPEHMEKSADDVELPNPHAGNGNGSAPSNGAGA
jgi:phenylpropionate dioxygenase-like ring-hydroxylating dioxygenase large terminal subunit